MLGTIRSLVTKSLLIVGASSPLARATDRAALSACVPAELRGAVPRALAESDALARSTARRRSCHGATLAPTARALDSRATSAP